MRLTLTLPFRLAVDEPVRKVSAEGEAGSFTLLPNHVDYLSSVVPGLLWYEQEDAREVFYAVGRGLLVKVGEQVRVAVGQAVRADRLEDVRRAVEESIARQNEQEQRAQHALERMRADFARRFVDLEIHE
jgi:F-type H+-transporting ATPase subunit epsilon